MDERRAAEGQQPAGEAADEEVLRDVARPVRWGPACRLAVHAGRAGAPGSAATPSPPPPRRPRSGRRAAPRATMKTRSIGPRTRPPFSCFSLVVAGTPTASRTRRTTMLAVASWAATTPSATTTAGSGQCATTVWSSQDGHPGTRSTAWMPSTATVVPTEHRPEARGSGARPRRRPEPAGVERARRRPAASRPGSPPSRTQQQESPARAGAERHDAEAQDQPACPQAPRAPAAPDGVVGGPAQVADPQGGQPHTHQDQAHGRSSSASVVSSAVSAKLR